MKRRILTGMAIALLAGLAFSCNKEKEDEPTQTYTLSLTADQGGMAVAEKNAYWVGEQVTVTATADSGYLFVGWYENGDSIATDAVYMFLMPARNLTLHARFAADGETPESPDIPDTDITEVDLGLSVKWAACNMGALAPEQFGGLYGWGDPSGEKHTTELNDYPSATPPENICGTAYDIATVQWGNGWRMPSQAEFQELVDNCTWEWTEVNGVKGRRATASNGNSIFFPAAASRDGENISNQVGQRGCYWSGTLYPGNDARYAYYFYFYDSNQFSNRNNRRYMGYSVRPVKE